MTDNTEAARDLMARIRRQVFVGDGSTMGQCPRCGESSRGSMTCADCLGMELDDLIDSSSGTVYVYACEAQRDAEQDVLRRAGDG